MRQKIKTKKGFSLIEATISIYIVSMGLLGVMSLLIQNLQVQFINKNSMIASGLAQEGLELARNIRDTYWKDANQPNLVSGSILAVDYNSSSVGVADIDSAPLYINADGFYVKSVTATTTPFKRIITVNSGVDTNDDPYKKLVCTVRWKERGQIRDYILETRLYDWLKPNY